MSTSEDVRAKLDACVVTDLTIGELLEIFEELDEARAEIRTLSREKSLLERNNDARQRRALRWGRWNGAVQALRNHLGPDDPRSQELTGALRDAAQDLIEQARA